MAHKSPYAMEWYSIVCQGVDIVWTDIDARLVEWSGQPEEGRKLQVELIFYYDSSDEPALSKGVPRRPGPARQTRVERMHTNRSGQLRAKEETED